MHSEKLSPHIQKYFNNQDPKNISLEDKVEGLCLVAWERKKFLVKLRAMQNAFRVRLREVRLLVKLKTAKAIRRVKTEMASLFKKEFLLLLEQYNDCERRKRWAEQELERFKTSVHVVELLKHQKYVLDDGV